MKKRYLIIALVLIVFFVSLTSVSAQDNATGTIGSDIGGEKLEKTYFYDADYNEEFEDDTIITHNVVKYYGDTDTKFKVRVIDDDYEPIGGVCVKFDGGNGKQKEKFTNYNGNVYFPINYKVGKYYTWTEVEEDDGSSYWYAENTITIKSTIPTKELVKFSTSKKKFKIRFLDTKGYALAGKTVKIKKNSHWHKLKTDADGYVKIKSNFKRGKHKIVAYNPASKEKRNIPVVVLKKGVHRVNVAFVVSDHVIKSKKLKNGDHIDTVYETKYRQYYPGVYVEATGGGLSYPKHTKLLKAKYFFKNKKTGKIITKTSKKVKYYSIVIKPIKGYVPYKAKVWYRDVKKLVLK